MDPRTIAAVTQADFSAYAVATPYAKVASAKTGAQFLMNSALLVFILADVYRMCGFQVLDLKSDKALFLSTEVAFPASDQHGYLPRVSADQAKRIHDMLGRTLTDGVAMISRTLALIRRSGLEVALKTAPGNLLGVLIEGACSGDQLASAVTRGGALQVAGLPLEVHRAVLGALGETLAGLYAIQEARSLWPPDSVGPIRATLTLLYLAGVIPHLHDEGLCIQLYRAAALCARSESPLSPFALGLTSGQVRETPAPKGVSGSSSFQSRVTKKPRSGSNGGNRGGR